MRAILFLTVASLMAGQAVPAAAATWLEQKLKEVDRNICQNYKSVKCKARGKPAATVKAGSVKPVAKPKAAPVDRTMAASEPAAPSVTKPVPKPRAKPAIAPVVTPEDKPPELKGTVIAKSPPPGGEVAKAEPQTPGPAPTMEQEQPEQPVQAEQPVSEAKSDMAEPPLAIPPPKPRAKPKLSAKVAVVVPREAPETEPPVPSHQSGSCLSQLAAVGVKFNVVTKPVGHGACQVRDPVQLVAQRVDDNTVTFPDQPTLNCAFALEFAKWMREKGEPIASAAGTHVSKFYTGPGYQCRGRNGDNSAKISEHGYGNAIDIERMEMANGKLYLVEDVRSLFKPGAGTMKKMRSSACDYFTTVLGPGANAAHEKHFHFDMGKHGRSGTYKICE